MIDLSKAQRFEQMWKSTCLQSVYAFEELWIVEGPNMVRPILFRWPLFEKRLSSTELALYNFFRGIYSFPNHKMLHALQYWGPTTDEGKMIIEWLNDKFWF